MVKLIGLWKPTQENITVQVADWASGVYICIHTYVYICLRDRVMHLPEWC